MSARISIEIIRGLMNSRKKCEVKEQKESGNENKKKRKQGAGNDSVTSSEPSMSAEDLLKYFQSPLNKAIHAFVLTQLVGVYNVQKELQSEKPVTSVSVNIVLDSYIKLLTRLIDSNSLQCPRIENIDPRDKLLWKKQGVTLHPDVAAQVNSLSDKDKETFKNASQGFLSELCEQYRQRFDFRTDSIVSLRCLHPKML
ncbi:hypothetical protein QAD02_012605 [Eretmocerus hayati]|uniref:Uncharacterized protein n=1 Tax=Eretmocerus hayati TaxID=131215 RepID=A0ACC2P144_9HYME|nr:hypothetical protein QAD02_012605 [Eretmocerus hayati]